MKKQQRNKKGFVTIKKIDWWHLIILLGGIFFIIIGFLGASEIARMINPPRDISFFASMMILIQGIGLILIYLLLDKTHEVEIPVEYEK